MIDAESTPHVPEMPTNAASAPDPVNGVAGFGSDSGFTPEQINAGLSVPAVAEAAADRENPFPAGLPRTPWRRLWRRLRAL